MRDEPVDTMEIELKNLQTELNEDVYKTVQSHMNYLDDRRRQLVMKIEFHKRAMQQLGEACEHIDKYLQNEIYANREVDSADSVNTDEWTEINVKNSKY